METKDHFNSASAARLESFYARLSTVPEGAEIVELLKRTNTTVTFDPNRKIGNYTNINFKHLNGRSINYTGFEICLCDSSTDETLIQALIHESQHIRHHSNKLGNPEFERTIEQECVLRRSQEADAQTKATEICWLLKQAGDAGPWNAASNSLYIDMCIAYETEMNKSGGKIAARRAAYDAWFMEDRLCFYDYNTFLNNSGAIAYMVKDNLSREAIDAAQSQLVDVLHRIGELTPDVQNYLTLPGTVPVDGPPYIRNLALNLASVREKEEAKAVGGASAYKPYPLPPAA